MNSYSYPGKRHFQARSINGITVTACNRKASESGPMVTDASKVTCKQCLNYMSKWQMEASKQLSERL